MQTCDLVGATEKYCRFGETPDTASGEISVTIDQPLSICPTSIPYVEYVETMLPAKYNSVIGMIEAPLAGENP